MFQKINTAFRDACKNIQMKATHLVGADFDDPTALLNVHMAVSITFNILEIMFLSFLVELFLLIEGTVQFLFNYTSPCDSEIYGTISRTFYLSPSRLLMQGTSYLLWIDEQLPILYQRSEDRYQRDVDTWRVLTRRCDRDSC